MLTLSQVVVTEIIDDAPYTTVFDASEITPEGLEEITKNCIFARTEKTMFNDRKEISMKFYANASKNSTYERKYISIDFLE